MIVLNIPPYIQAAIKYFFIREHMELLTCAILLGPFALEFKFLSYKICMKIDFELI